MKLLKIPGEAHSGKVNCLAIDDKSEALFTGGEDGQVCLWDVLTLAAVAQKNKQTERDVGKLKAYKIVTPGSEKVPITSLHVVGKTLISVDLKNNVYKTDLESFESETLLTHNEEINDVTVLGGKLLLLATLNQVLTFDLDSNQAKTPIEMRTDIRAISVDPTQQYLAAIGLNKLVLIYQIDYTEETVSVKETASNGLPPLSCVNSTCKFTWSALGDCFIVPNVSIDPQTSGMGLVSRSNWKVDCSLLGQDSSIAKFCPTLFTENGGKPTSLIASVGTDKSVAVWNSSFQRPLFTANNVSVSDINDLQWIKNGSGLFVAAESLFIFTFDDSEIGVPISQQLFESLLSQIELPEPLKVVKSIKLEDDDVTMTEEKDVGNSTPVPEQQEVKPSEEASKEVKQTESPKDNSKKRVAPTSLDDPKTNSVTAKSTPTPAPSNGNVTSEFDQPSYLVSKKLKRKEETQPTNLNPEQQKKKREIDYIEIVGSVPINPNVSFARIRLATKKITSSIVLQSPNDSTLTLEIRNGSGNEQKPTKVSLMKNGSKQIFIDFIPKLISLATGGEGEFWAVSSANGVIYVYSDSGRRIFPPLVLGTPLSFLESKGQYLLAITSIGEVYAWDVLKRKALFEPTTLYPILSRSNPEILTRSENLTLSAITSSGVPIVTLANGNGYLYDKDMESWVLVSDSWWAFGSQYWDSIDEKSNGAIINILERKTNDEIVRRGRGKFLQKMAKTMLMKEGYENLEKIISLAHLENRILISVKLEEAQDFKSFLIIYCKRISELGFKAKLLEIFEQLYNFETGDDKMLGFSKHDLLKEIIYQCASIRSVQRILIQYATQLNILDQVHFLDAA